MWWRGTLGVVLVSLACAGACGTSVDATVAAPLPPAPPTFGPCPEGWREVALDDGTLRRCEPWPEVGRSTDCAADEAHFPGEPGCARIGPACPADGWPVGLPETAEVVYVDDDASGTGDGTTRATAFRSITDALAHAPAAAVIAVATGRYDEAVTLTEGRALWGACVAETQLTSTVPDDRDPVLTIFGRGSVVRNFTFAAPVRPAIGAAAQHSTIEHVVIDDARTGGIVVALSGATVNVHDVAVRNTQPGTDGIGGIGIGVGAGGIVTLDRAELIGNHTAGLSSGGQGAHLDATDVAVIGTMPDPMGNAAGVFAGTNGSLGLTRVVIESNVSVGLWARDTGTEAHATDVVVRDGVSLPNGALGLGVSVTSGASLSLARAFVSGNAEEGILVRDPESVLDAQDVAVLDTRVALLDPMTGVMGLGQGLSAQLGGTLHLQRAYVARSQTEGLIVAGAGTSAIIDDVLITSSRTLTDGTLGGGLNVAAGASLAVNRARVEGCHQYGATIHDVGTSASFLDLDVRAVIPGMNGRGVGLAASGASRTSVTRARFSEESGIAIRGFDLGTRIEARDLLVSDVRPDTNGDFGVAIFGQDGVTIRIEGARLERAHTAAIVATAMETLVSASNLF